MRMPATGIEPVLCHHNRILSPARLPVPPRRHLMGRGGFEPPKQFAADLQSVPFGHSGICPLVKYALTKIDYSIPCSNVQAIKYLNFTPGLLTEGKNSYYIIFRNSSFKSSTLASFGFPGAHASACADSAKN